MTKSIKIWVDSIDEEGPKTSFANTHDQKLTQDDQKFVLVGIKKWTKTTNSQIRQLLETKDHQ